MSYTDYEITDYEIDYTYKKSYEAKVSLVIDGAWSDCYVDFTVSFDDEIPLVAINGVWLESLDKMITLPEDMQYKIEAELEESGPLLDWLADELASLSDYYYDMYKEG